MARPSRLGIPAIAVVAAVAGLAALHGAGPARAEAAGCPPPPSGPPIDHGPRTTPAVALTFDDGPSPFTARMLALLQSAGAKATFFPQADRIRGREGLVRRAVAAGMEIGNHTFTHADLGNGGPVATAEMRRATAAVRAVTGVTPCLFRPPYRSVGNDLLPRARALGLATVNGDVDPSDWQQPGTRAIVSRVLARTRPGSIVVLHDGGGDRSQTLAALPAILQAFRARGYTMTTVSGLLGRAP